MKSIMIEILRYKNSSLGKYSVILACTHLVNLVLEHGITEVHADATFKVVPSNMGSQLLSLHFMIDNIVSYFSFNIKFSFAHYYFYWHNIIYLSENIIKV